MSHKTKRLCREKQCAKCPWKLSTDPNDIPNGYSEAKHKNLKKTINSGMRSIGGIQSVMGCHEEDEAHCIGWLVNQLGVGNNLGLRMRMLKHDLSRVEVFGEQHETFEGTLK